MSKGYYREVATTMLNRVVIARHGESEQVAAAKQIASRHMLSLSYFHDENGDVILLWGAP